MTTTDNNKPVIDTVDSSTTGAPTAAPAKKASPKRASAAKAKAAVTSEKNPETPPKLPAKTAKTTKSAPKSTPKTSTKTAVKATAEPSDDASSTVEKATAAEKVKAAPKRVPATKKAPTTTALKENTDKAQAQTRVQAPTPVTQNAVVASSTTEDLAVQTTVDSHEKTKAAKRLDKIAAKNTRPTDLSSRIQSKLIIYAQLMRLDRPIGILLLLWPTLWSLWLAAKGVPSLKNLVIFSLGVVVMRSAGCVINDFADRKIDGKVMRTQDRPLARGAASSREAIGLFIALCVIALGLVLLTDPLTIKLSVGGLILAFCYPFMKRHTHLPQVVLGAAFAWSIPMAFAAEAGDLPESLWIVYLAVVLWTVTYDTFYAMVDRDDDIKIGVKSTAILFGEQDRFFTGVLQIMTLYSLFIIGDRFELGGIYYAGLTLAAGLFGYQQWLIRFRERSACFKAFLNNNWVGLTLFVAIVMDLALR